MKPNLSKIKKRIEFIYLSIICITLFLTSYSISNNIKLGKNLSICNKEIVGYKERVHFLLKTTSSREYLQLKAGSTELNLNARLTSINSDTITLYELIGEKDKLFFRISENSCGACIEMEMDILEQNVIKIGLNKIIILASYKNLRHLKLFKQKLKHDIAIYNLTEPIGFPNELGDTPFLFVIDSFQEVEFVFIPEKTLPKLSEQYYSFLIDEFNRSN